jgi:acyl-CoA synthetase (AMP-forming)/AMP-acid ligase II
MCHDARVQRHQRRLTGTGKTMIAILDGISEPVKARPVCVAEQRDTVSCGDLSSGAETTSQFSCLSSYPLPEGEGTMDEVVSAQPPGNVGLEFLRTAWRFREHPAFVTPSQQLSYSFFVRAALNVSCFLSDQPEFRPGSRVLLLAGNSPEYLAGFYGTLLAEGVVVPLPATVDPARLERVRADSEAAILLTNRQLAERRRDLSLVPNERVDLDIESPQPPYHLAEQPAHDNELALLLYTSGSTARPKGVMLSHRNLLANARSILDFLPIRQQDRTLALLPFCHAFGNSVLQTHILSGATLVVDGSPTFPNTIVEALQRHRVSSFAGVPELYNSLLSYSDVGRLPLPDLRYMTVAGGALQPEAALKVAELIAPAHFFTMYGQTEATARLAYLPPDQLHQRPGSIGKAIPGVELQVQDPSGRQVAPGEIGELCARGANVMLGYWNDEAATADVLRTAGRPTSAAVPSPPGRGQGEGQKNQEVIIPPFPSGGWLRTGDLACTDDDGFFYFKGRQTNEIKICGVRVDLAAVIAALNTRFPGCRLTVVPFQLNHTTRLAMFVASSKTPFLSIERIRDICRATLARHEVPAYIEVVDRFSLNAALKVDLPALAQRAAERYESSQFTAPRIYGETSSTVTEVQI